MCPSLAKDNPLDFDHGFCGQILLYTITKIIPNLV